MDIYKEMPVNNIEGRTRKSSVRYSHRTTSSRFRITKDHLRGMRITSITLLMIWFLLLVSNSTS